MNEAIRVVPAVEVRQTFTPSQPLRELLGEFITNEENNDTTTRLSAGLLFRSYRRRVIAAKDYVAYEKNRNGVLRNAELQFEKLQPSQIPVEQVRVERASERAKKDRVQIALDLSNTLLRSNLILSQIPTVERLTTDALRPEYGRVLQADLPSATVLPYGLAYNVAYTKVQRELRADRERNSRLYYVQPGRLVSREVIIQESHLT